MLIKKVQSYELVTQCSALEIQPTIRNSATTHQLILLTWNLSVYQYSNESHL